MTQATEVAPEVGERPEMGPLGLYLDGDDHAIRERARGALSLPELKPVWGLPTDEYRDLVMDWMKKLASTGQTSVGFPEDVGGENDVRASVVAFETMGHGDLSLLVKCGVQFGLFGGAILHLGNEEHRRTYLPGVISCELPGCFAMTETGHGSNVQALGTTATYDPDRQEFVVHTPDDESRKDYIGNAARHGRVAVVFAQLVIGGESRGVHAFIVPLRDEDGRPFQGIRIEDCGPKLGLDGVDNGRIWFDNVRIPRTDLLDRYAHVDENGEYQSPIENDNRRFFTTIGTLIQGRVSVSGAAQSATKSALTIAVRYALKRRQFGPPGSDEEALLLDYRVHQRRLLPLLATTYALHFAQRELVTGLHEAFTSEERNDRGVRQLESYAAGIKAFATWHATCAIQTARECCGGAGYLAENRFAALKADTDVFTTFEGDNTVLMQLVAKGLLTDYSEHFSDLSQLELVRFVGNQVYEQVVERTLARQLVTRLVDAVTPSNDEEPEIGGRDYQLELFRWREEHLIDGVARRLKRGIDAGEDQFDVFNKVQDHVLKTAHAWVERQILEKFCAAVDSCEDEAVKDTLAKLCSLYALHAIEADRGWFFEHGRMTGPRAKAITREINNLLDELRPQAAELVDAFGIPDAALAAPIGISGSSG